MKTDDIQELRNRVLLMGLSLSTGTTVSALECPKCRGGDNGELTFSLTRKDGKLLFQCHRNKCRFYGVIGSSGIDSGPPDKKVQYQAFGYETRKLCTSELSFINEKFGILPEEIKQWKYCDELYRVIIPMIGSQSQRVGVVARYYPELDIRNLKPSYMRNKALVFMEKEGEPKAHFQNVSEENDTVFLVEDVVSAVKAARYTNAVALLGTHISDALIDRLVKCNFKKVCLALDKDAWKTAVELKQKHGINFGNFSLVPLSKDIKDMLDKDVMELIREYV